VDELADRFVQPDGWSILGKASEEVEDRLVGDLARNGPKFPAGLESCRPQVTGLIEFSITEAADENAVSRIDIGIRFRRSVPAARSRRV
jgi:hypothetical protein